VSGASAYRWEGWETDAAAVLELLAKIFLDPHPAARFRPARACRAVVVREGALSTAARASPPPRAGPVASERASGRIYEVEAAGGDGVHH